MTKDTKEQLECVLSELNKAKKELVKLKTFMNIHKSKWFSWSHAERFDVINGNIELAEGWIKRVIAGEKLTKVND